MNNPTTEQAAIAAAALKKLGEQAGTDPVAQLQQLAADDGHRLDATELANLADYEQLLDRQAIALRALTRIRITHVRGDALQAAADRLDRPSAPHRTNRAGAQTWSDR